MHRSVAQHEQLIPLPIKKIQNALLTWYESNARDLPWRQSRDPYHIWLSEIMLQQTQVVRVRTYYERFLQRFPTLVSLARADEDDVLTMWAGLGYYRRARLFLKAVRLVVSQYGGEVPQDYSEFRSLPGVGDYTAGAVLSIAFNKPYPAVDGNVLRVLTRLTAYNEPIDRAKGKRAMHQLASQLMPSDNPGDWNQAVMELGALICRPKSPRCHACPLAAWCGAYHDDTTQLFPVTSNKQRVRHVQRLVGIVQHEQRIVLVQRPPQGLLARMWDLPAVEGKLTDWQLPGERVQVLTKELEEAGFQGVRVHTAAGQAAHQFSHIHWHMHIYICCVTSLPSQARYRAVAWNDLQQYPIAQATQKALNIFRTEVL